MDRWFPSTQLCSDCGVLGGKKPLSVREWRCDCGAVHDRDENAARNILAAGLAATACGDGVSPDASPAIVGEAGTPGVRVNGTEGIPAGHDGEDVKSP